MANKLVFHKVRMKNFRSVSNMWLDVNLDNSPTTMICSNDNGAGKSTTTLWALTFVLFDTPYGKKTKKASLVNSRSNKDCVVEVEFTTKGSKYLVRRGIKPNLFDIEKDGVRVEDEASGGNYQKYLESVIGMDEKLFYYTIALGPARFVPFAEMGAKERREYVEPILDISIITPMNERSKENLKAIKKESDDYFYKISLKESDLNGLRRTVNVLLDQKRARMESSSEELVNLKSQIATELKKIDMIDAKIREIEANIDDSELAKLTQLNTFLHRFTSKKEGFEKSIKDMQSLNNCPTCQQTVGEEHKESICVKIQTEIDALEQPMEKLISELQRLDGIKSQNETYRTQIDKLKQMRNTSASSVGIFESNVRMIERNLEIEGEEEKIADINGQIEYAEIQLKELEELLSTNKVKEKEYEFLLQVLKDTGVKADILRQYIPYLNQRINSYLDDMNLFVHIEMDEDFNLTMISPTRKNQTLESLSTGQLRRVDLAVLLSFIEIAREKSSLSTNLLILDEILENLSEQGVSDFMEFWEKRFRESNFNLFVITQRNAEFEPFFDDKITYRLVDDYTEIVQ